MNIVDAANNGEFGLEIMDECFDFTNIDKKYIAMIVFESKINAKKTNGEQCKIGDKIRVLSDKAPTIEADGSIHLTGAELCCMDKEFFTLNGKPVQGELLNSVARISEVHLRD